MMMDLECQGRCDRRLDVDIDDEWWMKQTMPFSGHPNYRLVYNWIKYGEARGLRSRINCLKHVYNRDAKRRGLTLESYLEQKLQIPSVTSSTDDSPIGNILSYYSISDLFITVHIILSHHIVNIFMI